MGILALRYAVDDFLIALKKGTTDGLRGEASNAVESAPKASPRKKRIRLPARAEGHSLCAGEPSGAPIICLACVFLWQLFLAGKGKLLNIERTTELFGSLGIPLPVLNAYLAGATECFGGLLLVAGLGSRLVAMPGRI